MQRGNEAPFLPHAVPAAQKHQSKCGEKPKKELCKTSNGGGSPFFLLVVKFNLSRQQLHDFILCGASFRLERIDRFASKEKRRRSITKGTF